MTREELEAAYGVYIRALTFHGVDASNYRLVKDFNGYHVAIIDPIKYTEYQPFGPRTHKAAELYQMLQFAASTLYQVELAWPVTDASEPGHPDNPRTM